MEEQQNYTVISLLLQSAHYHTCFKRHADVILKRTFTKNAQKAERWLFIVTTVHIFKHYYLSTIFNIAKTKNKESNEISSQHHISKRYLYEDKHQKYDKGEKGPNKMDQ